LKEDVSICSPPFCAGFEMNRSSFPPFRTLTSQRGDKLPRFQKISHGNNQQQFEYLHLLYSIHMRGYGLVITEKEVQKMQKSPRSYENLIELL